MLPSVHTLLPFPPGGDASLRVKLVFAANSIVEPSSSMKMDAAPPVTTMLWLTVNTSDQSLNCKVWRKPMATSRVAGPAFMLSNRTTSLVEPFIPGYCLGPAGLPLCSQSPPPAFDQLPPTPPGASHIQVPAGHQRSYRTSRLRRAFRLTVLLCVVKNRLQTLPIHAGNFILQFLEKTLVRESIGPFTLRSYEGRWDGSFTVMFKPVQHSPYEKKVASTD